MGKLIMCWWWRVWVFRKDKTKLYHNEGRVPLLETFVNAKDNRYVIHIGKNYFIPCSIAEYKYNPLQSLGADEGGFLKAFKLPDDE